MSLIRYPTNNESVLQSNKETVCITDGAKQLDNNGRRENPGRFLQMKESKIFHRIELQSKQLPLFVSLIHGVDQIIGQIIDQAVFFRLLSYRCVLIKFVMFRPGQLFSVAEGHNPTALSCYCIIICGFLVFISPSPIIASD